ncbi:uncharacterized protein BDR25DRAFT_125267 [Lindgomyces ingoldianus]|uniref:Uncharacterized protein n=1 Tax=Lindgomyces ingoldianus TaxID=673940 RepID=A0ACB6R3S5_9PLEO|nr:uncharacterized protein BDR25DRAFT_125267 [Lindgomyces ingoldianus]KAF2473801.1 hypothetical protein BDR25DRAFT_125267 [Lindgomyces ingoldianus]
MVHDESFCGDRLRMSSFLRVIANMPPRPARFRRHEKQADQQSHAMYDEVGLNQFEELKTHKFSSQNPALASHDSSTEVCDSLARLASAQSLLMVAGRAERSEAENGSAPDTGNGVHKPSGAQSTAPRARKDHYSYQTKTNKSKHASGRRSGTRRRMLPVNELALVRTTTTDGLPDPSEEDVILKSPITEIDPIEDSEVYGDVPAQVRNEATQKSHLSKGDQVNYTNKATWKSRRRTKQGRLDVRVLQSVLASDGFVGAEFSIPFRHQKQPNRPQMKKMVPVAQRGLILAMGNLPKPSFQSDRLQLVQGSQMFDARLPNRLSRIPRLGEGNESWNEETPARPMRDTPGGHDTSTVRSKPIRRKTKHWIHNQLASISAPTRHSTNSGSEATEEPDERNSSFNDPNDSITNTRSEFSSDELKE